MLSADLPDPVSEFYKKGCQEKSSASTGERGFFLEIQPTVVSRLSGEVWLVVHSREFLCPGDDAIELERAASETGCFRGNHGSIRGSWPMAISGYPRGHNV